MTLSLRFVACALLASIGGTVLICAWVVLLLRGYREGVAFAMVAAVPTLILGWLIWRVRRSRQS